MSKQLKAALDKQLSGIAVNQQLEKRIIALPKARQKARRRSTATIVLCGVLLIALPVLAAASPSFQALLLRVGDQIAAVLQPIELICESNGIRMEVVAAMNDDSNAVAYITLQDMTEDRLAGIIDLYQYGISQTGMSYASTAQYDENTRTATLRILSYGGEKLNGRKVNFRLQSFLTGRQEWKEVDIGIPLDTIQTANSTTWLERDAWQGWSGGDNLDEIIANGGLTILPVDALHIPIPGVDFAYISNIGLIDGRLHVQTCWTKKGVLPANLDDHGEAWLVGKDGQPLPGDDHNMSVSFCVDAGGKLRNIGYDAQGLSWGEGTAYQEEIFTLDSDPAQYALRGYYATNKAYITGDWNVTFRLQAVKAFKKTDCDIDIGSGRIRTIMVSPIGWTLLGEKQPGSAVQAQVLVKKTGGTEQRFEMACPADYEATFEFYSFAEEPLDVEQIQEVSVNGQVVQLVEKQ